MKKIAVMNDLSSFGKCSLTAAIPVLSAMGLQCCPLPSAVLSGQTGFEHYYCKDLTDVIHEYIRSWKKNNIHFDSIYSGYMTGSRQIEYFLDFIKEFKEPNTFLLVDPVMGDDGSTYSMYTDEVLSKMRELTSFADLITPNLTEACLLAGYNLSEVYKNHDSSSLLSIAEEVGYKLISKAACNQEIIITGIKCPDDKSPFIYNLAVTENGVSTTKCHFFNKSFSGTGDLFASTVCGAKTNGLDTISAMNIATNFLYHSISDTMNEEINPMDGINFENHLIDLINGGNKND